MADPNQQIVLNSGQRPFPQTGSWSMLDLAKLPVQTTLGILSRYSAARVDSYTALVGEVLCQNFHLNAIGRRNLDVAVSSLKVVGSLGNILEFGFGIEDVVRTMAKSDRGSTCLGLCAALKECYSDDIAVEVLLEMARLVDVEGRHMPSSQSWKALLAACAGTLSGTRFPYLAEHLMHIHNNEHRLGAFRRLDATPTSVRSCSRPGSIAEALSGLARITRGELQEMTIYGGSDSGWLAALAEWLFGLKVRITNFDGTPYYSNSETDDAQVIVVMRENKDEIKPDILAARSTFVLNDVSQIFEKEARSPDALIVSGRVNWKHALSSTFLSEFNSLLKIKTSVGECIGSAARLFKGLSQGDESFPYLYRLACTNYSDTAQGAGFVLNTIRWFPELQSLKEIMLRSASQDLASARRRYEMCISTIRSQCNCDTCQSKLTGHDAFPEDDDGDVSMASEHEGEDGISPQEYDADQEDSEDEWDEDRFCQVVIIETIISLCRLFSNIILEDENLFPTRSGLEIAYGRQLDYRISARLGRSALREVGPIAFCLDFDNNFSFGTQVNNPEGVEIRLQNVLEVFAGRTPPSTNSNYSALCANGICAFLDIISETAVGTPDIDLASKIRILPGRISHEKKSYRMLIDRVQPGDFIDTGFSKALTFTDIPSHQLEFQLNVRESYPGLETWLQTERNLGPDARVKSARIYTGPSKLAVWLTSRRGLIPCRRLLKIQSKSSESTSRKDCSWSGPISLQEIREAASQKRMLELHDKRIHILTYRDITSAIAAIASTTELDPKYSIFIVERECLSCCMKAILEIDRPERTDFCIIRLSH